MVPDEQAAPLPEAAIALPSGRIERLARRYMRRAAAYSNRRFIIEMLVLSFILKIVGAVPLLLLGGDLTSGPSNTEQMTVEGPILLLIFSALVLAPPLETILFQWFLIWFSSLFTKRSTWKIGASALVFAIFHLPYGLVTVLSVLFPGIVFAVSFMVKRQESRWRAFWVTSLIHAAHNAVALAVFGLALAYE